ncbi:pseudouridine synthase [Aureococcus anophagefferens]|nr:pseudouridine synthase [Aureococcus anophagefferens]
MGKPQSSSEGAPEYVFDESSALSRRVKPYVFTYTMHCKGRWIGRRPAEIFAAEFKMNPASYYAEALADGRILVNGELCGDDLVLKNGDVLVHRAHRHEPPVRGGPIAVVGLDARVLAVDKPGTVPMHPCGSYHYNALSSLLAEDFTPRSFVAERGVDFRAAEAAAAAGLRQVHRLDRLTSGLVLLARSAEAATELCDCIGAATRGPDAARPDEDVDDDQPAKRRRPRESAVAAASARRDGRWRVVTSDGSVEVDCATRTKCHRDGVCECAPGGADAKASRTRFRLLRRHADGTSTVECHPRTGRTHQIRLHLQWLGHPIANDPNYGGTLGYGDSSYAAAPAPNAPPACPVADRGGPRRPGEDLDAFVARKYAGPGWAYETNLPAWATDGALPPEPEPEKRGCCVS